MSVHPLYDRVVVRVDNSEEPSKTSAGILLPESATENPTRGEVVAVGKGKVCQNGNLRSLELKVGDKVLFDKNVGKVVVIDGEEVFILREKKILAVLAQTGHAAHKHSHHSGKFWHK